MVFLFQGRKNKTLYSLVTYDYEAEIKMIGNDSIDVTRFEEIYLHIIFVICI